MARKGWASLSPTYRERLAKAGITEGEYQSGASIQKARGHEATPERPTRYNPNDFPVYHRNRQQLEAKLLQRKRDLWGDRPRWNESKANSNIREYPASMASLRWSLDEATDEEILDAISDTPEEFAWLGYH